MIYHPFLFLYFTYIIILLYIRRYLKVYCKIKRHFPQGFLRAKQIFATEVAKEKGMKNHPFFDYNQAYSATIVGVPVSCKGLAEPFAVTCAQ